MRRDIGKVPAVYPMPVLMVAAYDEQGKVNEMNAAWGMISAMDQITLFIDEEHKTTKNLRAVKAFTVSLADREHMAAADFFGIASGNSMEDKFERTGFHALKSTRVNAPIIQEFPVAMECELLEIVQTEHLHAVVGRILNTSADEKVLNEKGKVEISKLNALIFDQFQAGYYVTGERAGQAWGEGRVLMK